MIELLFDFYIIFNSFMAGCYFSYNYSHDDPIMHRMKVWFGVLMMILFGLIIIIAIVIAGMFAGMWETLQVKFFWDLHFTSKWNNIPEDKMETLNKAYRKNPKNIGDKIWNYCLSLVYEKNNYTPPKSKTDENQHRNRENAI